MKGLSSLNICIYGYIFLQTGKAIEQRNKIKQTLSRPFGLDRAYLLFQLFNWSNHEGSLKTRPPLHRAF